MSLATKMQGLRQIFFFDNRWQLFWDRLFFRKTTLNVYRLGPLEFIVDHAAGDTNGTRHVLASNMYKKFLVKMQLLAKIKVIDCGANGGGFPLLLQSMGTQIETLLCIEMNPNTFLRLEFNILHNLQSNIKLMNAALCGSRKTFSLNLSQGSTADNLYSAQPLIEGKTKCFAIEGYAFDALYSMAFQKTDIVDICKMDIEGAEYEVFLQPGHEFLARCRYLLLEMHNLADQNKTQVLVDEIHRLKFIKIDQDENVFLYRNENFTTT